MPSDHHVHYLVKDKHLLAQYLSCNLLPRKYHFYVTFWIPPEKDAVSVDAKMLLTYACHRTKSQNHRKRKAGEATVRYLRLGRMGLLIATAGVSPFFEREDWSDVRERPVCFGGYSIGVHRPSGKVSVRLHREGHNRLKKIILKLSCRRSLCWWEKQIWAFPFIPTAGVRDGVFSLLKHLNQCRKLFRKQPVEWKNCVRKKFTPAPAFLETPGEITELLRYEAKAAGKKKSPSTRKGKT